MRFLVRFVLVCSALLTPLLSYAMDDDWQLTNNHHAQVNFRAHTATSSDEVRLLVDISLEEGWKTYWRSPGTGGEAPSIQWKTLGISSLWSWPTPTRFDVLGIKTIGYTHAVSFPIDIKGNTPSTLEGTLVLPVCSNVCVIEDYPFSVSIEREQDKTFDSDYVMALAKVPVSEGLVTQVETGYRQGELQFILEQKGQWQKPELYMDSLSEVNFGEPKVKFEGHLVYVSIPVTDDWGDKARDIQGEDISFVVVDNQVAQELKAVVGNGSIIDEKVSTSGFWNAMIMALIGGLILNFMPCVLPVLGIKINNILNANLTDYKEVRGQFMASWMGIIFSFVVLAALMTVLRMTGSVLGWGIQFQNPWFIGVMVIVTAIFTANLFDLFNIHLNSSINTKLATHKKKGLAGAFLEGAFATLLATPCSAPFLGTAVAFALAAPLPMLWGLFIALGFGMGLPWLLIAIYPKCAMLLPKPGRWMNTLRVVLGVLMLLSCLWLLSLMAAHIGQVITVIVGGGFLLALLGMIAYRYSFKNAFYIFIISGVFAVGLVFLTMNPLSQNKDNINWQPLTTQAINEALSAKKRIFIDVTADWCITCKVNKINVIFDPEVQKALQADDVVALRGDWTTRSDDISNFLRENKSFAIPFNKVMGPNLIQGQTLPTILTKDSVLETLKQAKKE